jgi:hypothetical protein
MEFGYWKEIPKLSRRILLNKSFNPLTRVGKKLQKALFETGGWKESVLDDSCVLIQIQFRPLSHFAVVIYSLYVSLSAALNKWMQSIYRFIEFHTAHHDI